MATNSEAAQICQPRHASRQFQQAGCLIQYEVLQGGWNLKGTSNFSEPVGQCDLQQGQFGELLYPGPRSTSQVADLC